MRARLRTVIFLRYEARNLVSLLHIKFHLFYPNSFVPIALISCDQILAIGGTRSFATYRISFHTLINDYYLANTIN